MSKIGKIITFVGISGAALGGLWYFLNNTKKETEGVAEAEDKACDKEPEVEAPERSYVSLDPKPATDDQDKASLKKAVKEAVSEISAKADQAAEGVGLVKEEKDTKNYEFETFEDNKETE